MVMMYLPYFSITILRHFMYLMVYIRLSGMRSNDPAEALQTVLNTRRYFLLRHIAELPGEGSTISQLQASLPEQSPTGIYRDCLALEHAGLIRPTGGIPRRPHVESSWELATDVHALLFALAASFPQRS
jgi:hypothetical protein